MEYIAIKVIGINHWLWFKAKNVTHEGGIFTGKDGWGNGGGLIKDFNVHAKLIEGRMVSDVLMYN